MTGKSHLVTQLGHVELVAGSSWHESVVRLKQLLEGLQNQRVKKNSIIWRTRANKTSG